MSTTGNATAKRDKQKVQQIEAEVDRAAAELWSLTDAELKEIQDSLADLRG